MTREHVRRWITGWKRSQASGGTATLQEWIEGKIAAMNLEDGNVNTQGIEHVREDELPIAQYIMLDIPSYDNAPSS